MNTKLPDAQLSDRYFWDGKRLWQWNPSIREFVDYRSSDFKLHLRCDGVKNVEDRLAEATDAEDVILFVIHNDGVVTVRVSSPKTSEFVAAMALGIAQGLEQMN